MAGQTRYRYLCFRVSPLERAALKKMAQMEGEKVSGMIRLLIREGAERRAGPLALLSLAMEHADITVTGLDVTVTNQDVTVTNDG